VKLALENAGVQEYVEMQDETFEISYAMLDSAKRKIEKSGGEIIDISYGEKIVVKAKLPKSNAA
jgi:putative IMPACT (imprinted ancient) family translation regulator